MKLADVRYGIVSEPPVTGALKSNRHRSQLAVTEAACSTVTGPVKVVCPNSSTGTRSAAWPAIAIDSSYVWLP